MDNNQYSVKFSLDKDCISLLQLFQDAIQASGEIQLSPENPSQLTFQLRNMETVTVCTSEDNLRIMVQSNSASALQVILSELYSRLTSPKLGYDMTSKAKLPSAEFQKALLHHFEVRQSIKKLRKTLEDRSYQFR